MPSAAGHGKSIDYMKKLILSLTLAAFALSPTLFAGDAQQCPMAKAAGDKKACCAAQVKAGTCPNQAKKACCQKGAQAKAAKKAMSPKGAELALK